MVKSRAVRVFGFMVAMAIWGACTNIQNWIFRVGSKCAKGLMINFLAPVAFLWHCNRYFRQKQIALWCFVASSAEKTVQLYFLPSLSLLFISVHMKGPQEVHGGSAAALCKRPEWRWEECKEIPSAQLRLLRWRGAQGQPILLKHLRSTVVFSFAEQQINFFIFRAPVLNSFKTEWYSDLNHSLSLLILIQNLTSPPEGRA